MKLVKREAAVCISSMDQQLSPTQWLWFFFCVVRVLSRSSLSEKEEHEKISMLCCCSTIIVVSLSAVVCAYFRLLLDFLPLRHPRAIYTYSAAAPVSSCARQRLTNSPILSQEFCVVCDLTQVNGDRRYFKVKLKLYLFFLLCTRC